MGVGAVATAFVIFVQLTHLRCLGFGMQQEDKTFRNAARLPKDEVGRIEDLESAKVQAPLPPQGPSSVFSGLQQLKVVSR